MLIPNGTMSFLQTLVLQFLHAGMTRQLQKIGDGGACSWDFTLRTAAAHAGGGGGRQRMQAAGAAGATADAGGGGGRCNMQMGSVITMILRYVNFRTIKPISVVTVAV